MHHLLMFCLAVLGVVMLSSTLSPAQAAPLEVRVGGYPFPPYVDFGNEGEAHGLALDLISSLNRSQNRFHFRFVATSPNRRFQDFAAGRFDMLLFENQDWGWANNMMEASQPFLRDADRFVTQNGNGRDQDYFRELNNKRIFIIRGYHYAFANYESDPTILSRRFQLDWLDAKGSSLDRGLQQVAKGHAELMVVTDSYLQHYFRQRPDMAGLLLSANEPDTAYLHGALLRRQQPLTAAIFDELIAELQRRGELQRLAEYYGISHLLLPAPAP